MVRDAIANLQLGSNGPVFNPASAWIVSGQTKVRPWSNLPLSSGIISSSTYFSYHWKAGRLIGLLAKGAPAAGSAPSTTRQCSQTAPQKRKEVSPSASARSHRAAKGSINRSDCMYKNSWCRLCTSRFNFWANIIPTTLHNYTRTKKWWAWRGSDKDQWMTEDEDDKGEGT